MFFRANRVLNAGNRLQLINILRPTWNYESGQYGEWFKRFVVIDPKLQACRTAAVFEVIYRLQYGEGDGAALAGASIVLPVLERA